MSLESQTTPEGRKADAFEMNVRLACGGLLGLFIGLGVCVGLWPLGTLFICVIVAAAIVACGLGAARFGDGFWANLRWLQ